MTWVESEVPTTPPPRTTSPTRRYTSPRIAAHAEKPVQISPTVSPSESS
eukprot:CAMPEP_0119095294 /NCGR_PEP_ID=MMETSP1178-20130426/169058_1 /TAXON_ID=33656 /ORGANISM="unid sp, Strain CCMP2000" /LENGTH=48 /DNA_ID= /DNA_START= /DNA_END= /DNA_ORIENTATION=